MSAVRSSLARHVPSERSPAERLALRRDAWRTHGLVTLYPDEVRDPVIRQALVNEAERVLGQRRVRT